MKLIFIASFYIFFSTTVSNAKTYHIALNDDATITLDWYINQTEKSIIFELHTPIEYHWFALGFSNRGDQYPADYCTLWQSIVDKKYRLEDDFADGNGVLHRDKNQDCNAFRLHYLPANKKLLKWTFKRRFDTCDDGFDYVLEYGTTHVVWTGGFRAILKPDGLNISSGNNEDERMNQHLNNGMVRTSLLKRNEDIKENLASHVEALDIIVDNVAIPAVETTYWCHIHKLNFTDKRHYEAVIDEKNTGLVHHMEVFHCISNEMPLYKGDCFGSHRPRLTQICKRVLAAWAMGAPHFLYPEWAGLPLGGANFNPYVMVEVHYNNPGKLAGFLDNSGIRFYVSKVLRKYDAGIMELGLEYSDKMAIPPRQTNFQLIGYCVSECTAVGLQSDGISVFGSQLHTHLTGTRVYTRHIRDGIELPELNRDNHFSTHFQEIRLLTNPVQILPGDSLITVCDYNTEQRANITLGGFGITDEMCVNYIHYFPLSDLEVCKSSISDQALGTYFDYMRNWEGQKTDPKSPVSTNYESIEWNRMRVELLSSVYRESPLSMQCNMSSGDRFPGYWENTGAVSVLKPLPPPSRNC